MKSYARDLAFVISNYSGGPSVESDELSLLAQSVFNVVGTPVGDLLPAGFIDDVIVCQQINANSKVKLPLLEQAIIKFQLEGTLTRINDYASNKLDMPLSMSDLASTKLGLNMLDDAVQILENTLLFVAPQSLILVGAFAGIISAWHQIQSGEFRRSIKKVLPVYDLYGIVYSYIHQWTADFDSIVEETARTIDLENSVNLLDQCNAELIITQQSN